MSRRVSCLPSVEVAFGVAAAAALDKIDGQVSDHNVVFALADMLRPSYPTVHVRRQDPIARVAGDDVWYAYRDGKPYKRE
jgi:hypothetical protein